MTAATIANQDNKIIKLKMPSGPVKMKNGKLFTMHSMSIRDQIKNNAELIKKTRKQIAEHPENKRALEIALNSSVSMQSRLMDILASEYGIPSYVAIAIETASTKLIKINANKLTSLIDAAENLMQSICASYRRQINRRNLNFTLEVAMPYESSFGYFLLPKVVYRSKKTSPGQSEVINPIAKDAIIEPFYKILAMSDSEEDMREIFNTWGSDVASEYEKYMHIISDKNISVSMYSQERNFYTNKRFADSVLDKMARTMQEPSQETFKGKICGIITYKKNRQVVFARDGQKRIDASFAPGLENKILQYYKDFSVEASFIHKTERKTIYSKMYETWELTNIKPTKK